MDPQMRAEAIDEDLDGGWQGDDGYGGHAGDDGMDFYSDNPLFADPLFTPASTALRSGMRSNSAFEDTQAADLASFTGGSAYGAAGFGAQAAPPRSSSRQRQPGAFDPDPRLFGQAAEAAEAAVLQDEVQAIVLAGDALQPPTSTFSNLSPSPTGAHSGHNARQGAPEDIAFADVLGALMRNQIGAPDAVQQYAAICSARARELRAAAAGQLQRAARYIALRDEANALDDEAATWMLLGHLAGDAGPRFPGGFGGGGPRDSGLPDAPQRRSIHQQAADIIAEDAEINRAARVVAWLEALAAQGLDDEAALSAAGGGTAGRFGAREGVWAETRLRLAAGIARSGDQPLVSELDPDASGRQRRPLHPENVADEERILSRLWRLVRAGRVAEALELCRECGQPWRAASLGGGGGFGPTPLGPAAAAADAADPSDQLADELADQVTRGDMVPRALWRWAALQVAEKAAAGGEPARRGPSAGTLEAAVYGALAGHLGAVLPACATWEDATWALGRCWLEATLDRRLAQDAQQDADMDDADAGLQVDALADALPEGGDAAILREGLDVAAGRWPLPRVLARLPRDFRDIFIDESAADAVAVRVELDRNQRALQAALILERLQDAADRLVSWILPREGAERSCGPGAMRFAAHFALALRATGLVSEPSWEADQYDPLQEALNEVLQAYVVHAMESGAGWLVPQLACHLRAGRRHLTYSIFAEELTQRPIAECAAAFAEADAWFSAWQGGDVQPDEMLIIADQIAQSTRRLPAGGPVGCAQAARWLTFARAQLPAALSHANALAREFALGLNAAPGPSAAAGWALMHEVLPSSELGVVLSADDAQLSALGQLPDAAQVAEARAWTLAFDHERRFQQWQATYGEAAASGQPQGAQADALHEEAQQLLQGLLDVLSGGGLESALTRQQDEGSPPEVVLMAVPAGLVEPDDGGAAAALAAGAAFPALRPADAAAAAEVARASLQAAVAASPRAAAAGVRVEAAAPDADSDAAGLLQIRVVAEGPAAVGVVAALAAGAVKGALPGGAPGAGPLWVINAEGGAPAVAGAVWRVLAPRLALQCAELRQAVIALGGPADAGAELALLVAGMPRQQAGDATGFGGQPGLAAAFSEAELRQLLDWERAAALLAMHRAEAAARADAIGAN